MLDSPFNLLGRNYVSGSNANYSGLILLTHLQFIADKVLNGTHVLKNYFTLYGVEGFWFIIHCILICSSDQLIFFFFLSRF